MICLKKKWIYKMKDCASECLKKNEGCKKEECRLWIDYKEDNNCTLIAIKKHGEMTLMEVAERMKVSFVRIKQIQDKAIKKISKEKFEEDLFTQEDGFF